MESVNGKKTGDNVDEICRTLLEYCSRSRRALNSDGISKKQVTELASAIEEIRLLLQELTKSRRPHAGREVLRQLGSLHEQYVELEGLAKEKRNDLGGPNISGTA